MNVPRLTFTIVLTVAAAGSFALAGEEPESKPSQPGATIPKTNNDNSYEDIVDMPAVKIVSEMVKDGRKVVCYEHGSAERWGYAANQTYRFYLVHPAGQVAGKAPLHVVLHSAGDHALLAMRATFDSKPQLRNPAYYGDDQTYILYLDCTHQPHDDWWGYHAIRDNPALYKDHLGPAERRVLSTVVWAAKEKAFNIDPNRVYLSGVSMGGSGSLGIGLCRGDLFAAIYVMVPAGTEHMMARLPKGGHPDPPVIVDLSSPADGFSKGQDELIALFQANRYPLVFAWGGFGHWADAHSVNATLAKAFPWASLRKDEAYPVFTNASTDQCWPKQKNPTRSDPAGQINGYFRWKSVSDAPDKLVLEVRLVKQSELKELIDEALKKYPEKYPPEKPLEFPRAATADVTFRRLQKFAVEKGKLYKWQATSGSAAGQAGNIQADAEGLLTIPKLTVTDEVTTLSLEPAQPAKAAPIQQ